MTEILVPEFVKGILIFLRITGILIAAPFFNVKSIPNTFKMFFALAITYMVFFFTPDVDKQIYSNMLILGLSGVKEVLIGVIIGFSINFIFYGISFSGLIIGYEMGLMIAQMFDPTTESTNNIMGQVLLMIGLMIFVIINGPHFIVRSVSYSYQVIPIGFFHISQDVFNLIIKYSAGVFLLAIKISAPILISFFLLDLGAGVIARVIPQMNVFFVVAPLKIGLGLGLLMAVLPLYVYVLKNILLRYEDKILELMQALGQ